MIYFLTHEIPGFNGVFGGVDFVAGRGSTSSAQDAIRLCGLGCRLVDETQRAEIRKLALELGRRRRERLAEIRKQDEFERTPAYTASALRRMAEREAQAKERKIRPHRWHR